MRAASIETMETHMATMLRLLPQSAQVRKQRMDSTAMVLITASETCGIRLSGCVRRRKEARNARRR